MKEYEYILISSTETLNLTENPVNWDDLGITLMRSELYGSVLRNFTITLKFANAVGTGYDLIKKEYDTNGIYGNVDIVISYLNHSTNDYDFFYSGKLDFKPPKFAIDRDLYIETVIIDNNKLELLKAREETEFNLFDLVTPDEVTVDDFATEKTVTIPDLPVILEAQFKAQGSATGNIGDNEQKRCYLTSTETVSNQIGDSITLDGGVQIYINSHDEAINFHFLPVGYYIFYGTIVNPYPSWETTRLFLAVECKVYGTSGLIETVTYFSKEIAMTSSSDKSYDERGELPYHPIDIEIPSGGYIEFQSRAHLYGANSVGYATTYLSLNFNTYPYRLYFEERLIGIGETTNKCLFIDEAFTRLIQLITSETDTTKLFRSSITGRTDSDFEAYVSNGEYSQDVLFSGLMLRNYPDSSLNLSLKKLFESHSAIYNTGLGFDYVNDRFYLEKKEQFYKSILIKDLGEVSEFKRTPMPKAYFSKIMAGYDFDGDYEDFNGAYEFNLSKEYATNAPVKDELSAVSKLRADSVGIELTRRKQYLENSSIDTKGDNDIFILRTDTGEPAYSFYTSGFPGADLYFNSMLSPRSNMIRWGNILKACLYKTDKAIKYIKSAKLFSLFIYSDETTSVDENSNLTQSELGTDLIIPEIYTFDGHLNESDIQNILAEPHGYFTFSYMGRNYEGFIDIIELKNYKRKANFTLIAKNIASINRTFEDGTNHTFEDATQKTNE